MAARRETSSPPTLARATRDSRGIVVPDLPAEPREAATALEQVSRALERVPEDGVLKMRLACDPEPLAAPLRRRGFRVRSERLAADHWSLELQPEGGPAILDLRDLEAPEPMERILEACAKLAPGAALMARTPCYPRPLFSQLEHRALLWAACEEPDGSALVHVRRPG